MTNQPHRESAPMTGSSCLARCEFEDWAAQQDDMPLERITGGQEEGDYADPLTHYAWMAWWAAWHAQDQKIGLLATELGKLSGAGRINPVAGSSVDDAIRPMFAR